jgi:hypothetical protein
METDSRGSRERYFAEAAAIEAEMKEFLEEIRPHIAEIESKMTPEEKQAVTDGILARFKAATDADAAAGRKPETPIQIAMAETLRDVKAAKSRKEEDEIIARFRQRSKEIAADYYASQKSQWK